MAVNLRKIVILVLLTLAVTVTNHCRDAHASQVTEIKALLGDLGFNTGPQNLSWYDVPARGARNFLSAAQLNPSDFELFDHRADTGDLSQLLDALRTFSDAAEVARRSVPGTNDTERIEKLLAALGYFSQTPDPVWSVATKLAASRFVDHNHLTSIELGTRGMAGAPLLIIYLVDAREAGRVNPAGQNAPSSLSEAAAPPQLMRNSASRLAIRRIESMLAGMGYDPGNLDGRWTDDTGLAVRAFANSLGKYEEIVIEAGIVDHEVLAHLLIAAGEVGHRADGASAPVPETSVAVAPQPTAPAALDETRVALVIGNSRYEHAASLRNPAGDARAMADAFRELGFSQVTLELDLGRDALASALRSFGDQALTADWAVIYFAGHGFEVDGVNYLVPVDAKLERDTHLRWEAIQLDDVLGAMTGASKIRLAILDACRNNPFTSRMQTSSTRSIGRGLALIEPEGGTLVAYAARHGQVALDGDGANSPYVSALLQHLDTEKLEISLLFRHVRDTVRQLTGQAQEPYVYGSLPSEALYFNPGGE